jgi:integrase
MVAAGKSDKNQRPHLLPLPQLAFEIIESVPRRVGRDHLFGERAERGFTRWWQLKLALDARLGNQVQPWHLHDLRRSLATRLGDLGVAPHVIETILNHVSGHKRGIGGVYNRSPYFADTQRALALWGDHIRSLVEGGERKIVSMQRSPS